jgi:hypothetical protein
VGERGGGEGGGGQARGDSVTQAAEGLQRLSRLRRRWAATRVRVAHAAEQ